MKIHKTVIFVTGQTASGKTEFLRKFIFPNGPRLNIISADILQMSREFPVLSNNQVGSASNPSKSMAPFVEAGATFHLYGCFDIWQVSNQSSFTYTNKVLPLLQPDALNIVEGGNGYYQFMLRQHLDPEWNAKAFVLYYDHLKRMQIIAKRSSEMLLRGGLEEVIRFETRLQSEGVDYPAALPIGYVSLRDFLNNAAQTQNFNKRQRITKAFANDVTNVFRSFAEQHRGYSTTQLKYCKKFYRGQGNYWFDVDNDAQWLATQKGSDLLALPPDGARPPNLDNFERSEKHDFNLKVRSSFTISLHPSEISRVGHMTLRLTPNKTSGK